MMTTNTFQSTIRDFFLENERIMPWRMADGGVFDPYRITVSEIMLQQTQVDRVIPKFYAFIDTFPDIASLASAPLQEVLLAWSGLGYNRRAKFLHDFAIAVSRLEKFPTTIEELSSYKGIGQNTAAAILVYTFNEPHAFIETNIRTVYINCFFDKEDKVSDKEILNKLALTLDRDNPREFYWALMDYGTFLKKQGKGSLERSKTHVKQSKFVGSHRQLRGKVIKIVSENDSTTSEYLQSLVQDKRLAAVLTQLEKEQMIKIKNKNISIA